MPEKWKKYTNAEVIHYNMPHAKEWEVLEYFAENNYSVFISLINTSVVNSPFTRKKIVEHYKDANLDELPENLKIYIVRSREFFADRAKRSQASESFLSKRNAKTKYFFTDKGELIQFFKLADDIPFTSIDDYFYVSSIFKSSELSIESFCEKYQIEDINGFKEAMRRVSIFNPEFDTYYNKVLTNARNEHINLCKNIISGVANETMSLSEVIENHTESTNFQKLLSLASFHFDNNTLDKFISAVIKYYIERTLSYDDTLDPENLKKMLSLKEVTFILSSEVAKNLKAGMNVSPIHHIKHAVMPFKDQIKSVNIHRAFDNSPTGLGSRLKSYTCLFKRKSYLKNNPLQVLEDGSILPVTDEVIDMAECFATQNNLFKGHGTIIRLNRCILNGKLDYSAETKAYKESLINKITSTLSECKTLTEYFESKNLSQKGSD